MMDQCGDLVPRQGCGGGVPLYNGESGECLLREGHQGEHLVLTELGYYVWMIQEWYCINDGQVCDCECIECYTYSNISDELAAEMIKAYG